MSAIDHQITGPLWKPTKSPKKTPKPIRQVGKVAISWAKRKAKFLKEHPPAHEGYWICGLCGGRVYKGSEDVDHKQNRSTHPELREAEDNLHIVHATCNIKKKFGGVS